MSENPPSRARVAVSAFACVLLAGAAALGRGAEPESAAPDDERPREDLLLVLLDDVGKDALAAYGAASPARTPVLDRLAREGIVYDRAYASPLCSPSRALLVTGRYGFRTGYGQNAATSPLDGGLGEPGTAERLRDAASPDPFAAPFIAPFVAWYGKWHLVTAGSPDADRHPITVGGFERFVGHLGNLGSEEEEEDGAPDTHHYRWRKVEADRAASRVEWIDGAELGYDERSWASAVCRAALSADLAALDPERQALTIFAPVAPHSPQQPPPVALVDEATAASVPAPGAFARPKVKLARGRRGLSRATYLAQIEALDTLIGRLLDDLPPERRARTTVVVFGDNGTPGELLPGSFDPGHGKGRVFEQGAGVPLIVAGPRVAAPGSRCDALVHLVDLPATAADVLGAGALGGDGRSFASTFADPARPGPRTTVFCEVFAPNVPGGVRDGDLARSQRALIGRRYKLVRHTNEGRATESLFDLAADPLETRDLLLEREALDDDARAAHERLARELDALLDG